MARRRKRKTVPKMSVKKYDPNVFYGLLLLLAGYLFTQGWAWTSVLMAIGGLLVLKGLYEMYQK